MPRMRPGARRLARPALALSASLWVSSASPGPAMTGPDVETEAECRWCHCPQPGDSPLYLPNRHHRKVGQPIPGSTGGERYDCFTAACHHQLVWNPDTSAYEFGSFRDCIACHGSTPDPGHHRPARYACDQCHVWSRDPAQGCSAQVLSSWCGGAPASPSGSGQGQE